jgi:hypothetical protein
MVTQMSEGKVIFDGVGPKSQPIDAVKAMIEFFDHKPCARLPKVVMLANNTRLIRSSKGDCYYVATPKACSCPGFFHHKSCKHIKAVRDAVVKEHVMDLHDTKPGEVEYWQEKELTASQKGAHELQKNIVEAQEA